MRGDRRVWAAAAALVLLLALAYAESFRAPFVFDDVPSIETNATIRGGPWTAQAWHPPGAGETVTGRPVLNATFAANYAWGGLNVPGYHAVTWAIHACAALLLFGLLRRTPGVPFGVAWLAAALWALHPLQTESVTYTAQRAESLMGLLYLLTLYAFVRSSFAVAWVACLLGMGTKEVMVSAPVLVLLYDRTFLASSWSEVARRRGAWHAALFATWGWLAWLVVSAHGRGGTSGFAAGVGFGHYLGSQALAIARYLRLAFWPAGLVFDYGNLYPTGWTQILPGALCFLGILGVAATWIRRPNAAAFLAIAFLAILAPSSLIPGNRQTLAEHRMYLALIPVVVGALVLFRRGLRAASPAVLAVLAFAALTQARTRDYLDPRRLWDSAAAGAPANAFAWNNAGIAWYQTGDAAEALARYQRAAVLNPRYADPHNNWGNVLLAQGDLAGAQAQVEAALALDPKYAEARSNSGVILAQQGRIAEARAAMDAAVALAPNEPKVRANRARLLLLTGDSAGAVREYRMAVDLNPVDPTAHFDLGNALAAAADSASAEREFLAALDLSPSYAAAHNNLGRLYATTGRLPEAVSHFTAAVEAAPSNAGFRANLAVALAQSGRRAAAVEQLEQALRLDPANAGLQSLLERLKSP